MRLSQRDHVDFIVIAFLHVVTSIPHNAHHGTVHWRQATRDVANMLLPSRMKEGGLED